MATHTPPRAISPDSCQPYHPGPGLLFLLPSLWQELLKIGFVNNAIQNLMLYPSQAIPHPSPSILHLHPSPSLWTPVPGWKYSCLFPVGKSQLTAYSLQKSASSSSSSNFPLTWGFLGLLEPGLRGRRGLRSWSVTPGSS